MPHAEVPEVPQVVLDDGAVVRGARDSDLPEMLALEVDREGADDAVDLELVAKTPGGLTTMSVVELDGRIVSMATLLDETLRLEGVELPAGQVEMVATAREAEGRGYVRALMHRSHALSRARGHVVQVMIGIPNFYRQFGYAYSIPMHPWATVSGGVSPPAGFTASPATERELPELLRLQEETQRPFGVSMPHSTDCWHWLLHHSSSQQILVRDGDGAARALARVYDDGEGSVDVGEVASRDDAATEALLGYALQAAGPEGTVRASVRPGVPGLAARTTGPERREWYYVRIPEPAVLLTAMGSALLRRVRAAEHPTGDALISFFGSHVRLHWDLDQLIVTPGGPLQAPVSAGGSGIPLDAFGSMVFAGGAESLEDRFPDASLGRQADVMRVLFPPVSADLLTFYLPS
jgi:predicted N-acetyltransferase YhbS